MTSWSGECTEKLTVIPMPGLVEGDRERTTDCDVKTYDVEVRCMRPGRAGGPVCAIEDERRARADDRMVLSAVKGRYGFEIAPNGLEPIAITVTLRRKGEHQVHHSPWLQPVVIRELVATCRSDGEPDDKARPCDQGVFPKQRPLWMRVRSKDTHVPAAGLRVNGRPSRTPSSSR